MLYPIAQDYATARRIQKLLREVAIALDETIPDSDGFLERDFSGRIAELLGFLGILSQELYIKNDIRVSAFGMSIVNLELGRPVQALKWLELEKSRERELDGELSKDQLDLIESKIVKTRAEYLSASSVDHLEN